MSDDKIKQVNFMPNGNRAALEGLKRERDAIKESMAVIAELRWSAYQSHIEQGFTEDQALELCKSFTL